MELTERFTATDVLQRACALLDEYDICRGHYAIDDTGQSVDIRSGEEVAYCAVGFLRRATEDLMGTCLCMAFKEAHEILAETAHVRSLHFWNDHEATDDEIRDAFHKAASLVPVIV